MVYPRREQICYTLRLPLLVRWLGEDTVVLLTNLLQFVALVHHSPFIVRPLMSGIWKSLRGAFYDVEVDLYMSYLNDQLKGRDFLLGSAPGRPDFLLSFVYDTMEQKQMIKQPNKYPLLHEWNNRCKARPAWVRSLEKGNGYDMSRFE